MFLVDDSKASVHTESGGGCRIQSTMNSLVVEQLEARLMLTEITDSLIITHHDRIPRLCGPAVVNERVVQSGFWSDPQIWADGSVPGAGAKVAIGPGVAVEYDVASTAELDCIEVSGELRFAPDKRTELHVTHLFVMPSGVMVHDGESEIVINDQPLETGTVLSPGRDPDQFGNGIIVLGNWYADGQSKTPFARLATEPKAGDHTLTFDQAIEGWRTGDTLFLPDSRQAPRTIANETLTIESVSGNTVRVSSPIAVAHPGARDAAGTLRYLPHVANLTRSIVVRSENPSGTRGHIFVTDHADLNISGVAIVDMGRTIGNGLGNTHDTKRLPNGTITQIGTNQVGRYALHMHRLNGPADPTGEYQYQVTDSVILNARKWSVAVHDSHWGLLRDNVMVGFQHAGLITEENGETGNVFDGNFAALGLNGYWFSGPSNVFTDNVAANTQRGVGYSGYNLKRAMLPVERGSGERVAQNLQQKPLPTYESSGNEFYGGSMQVGMYTAWHNGCCSAISNMQQPSTFSNYAIWHVGAGKEPKAVYSYHEGAMTFEGFVLLNDPVRGGQMTDAYTQGFTFDKAYENVAYAVRDSEVAGFHIGIGLPRRTSGMPISVERVSLSSYVNVLKPIADTEPILVDITMSFAPYLRSTRRLPSQPVNFWGGL